MIAKAEYISQEIDGLKQPSVVLQCLDFGFLAHVENFGNRAIALLFGHNAVGNEHGVIIV